MNYRSRADIERAHIASLTCSCTLQFREAVIDLAKKRRIGISLLIRDLLSEEMERDSKPSKQA